MVYNGVWATTVVFGKQYRLTKQEAISKLGALGIPARPFFHPLSSQPAYTSIGIGNQTLNPQAYDVSSRGITLPAHFNLTDDQIQFVCQGIRSIVET